MRRALVAAALALAPLGAAASSDPLVGLIAADGGAGVGVALSVTRSPYVDGGVRNDLVPLYLYENGHFYLHAYRIGLKFDREHDGFDFFLTHRFEGFPSDRIPSSLTGMADRGPGMDAGVGYERRFRWGTVYGEALRDVSHTSGGNELRLGYTYDWQRGRLRLRPYLTVSLRSARLNDYYYGVRPDEATPIRPAYEAGAGFNNEIGLYGSYRITERWRLIAGTSATRLSSEIRDSPVVKDRMEITAMAGAVYDFSPQHEAAADGSGKPLLIKLLYGKSTDCNLMPIMGLSCTSTATVDQTRVVGIEIGRPFVQHLNGWPLDFVGYFGLLRHDERGLQPDSWQFNAYVKGYWYGFPWDDRVRTRVGFGVGLSYAQRIPYVEARDQARRGRGTSRLLNYLDPSIDVSLGDVFGVPSLREAYFGFGVTHRSGIFGSSQLFGNVDGGSNYIYTYLEWPL